jgi:hypothetical protein
VTNFVPVEELAGFLKDIEEVIADVADEMMDHGDFLQQLPASTPPQAAAEPAVSFALRYERGEPA